MGEHRTVEDDEIRALLAEAEAAQNFRGIYACMMALDGSEQRREECARVIAEHPDWPGAMRRFRERRG